MNFTLLKTLPRPIIDDKTTFDFADNLDRTLGYHVTVELHVAIEDKIGDGWAPRAINAVGDWFRVWGAPLRNGSTYGPACNTAFFRTLAEAEACANKRVADCRKRYFKKYGATSTWTPGPAVTKRSLQRR